MLNKEALSQFMKAPPTLKNGSELTGALAGVATYCGDPRHNGRKVVSILREQTADDFYDPSWMAQLRQLVTHDHGRLDLKQLNLRLHTSIKIFNTTPAGGRYSKDSLNYYHIANSLPEAELVRHYLGDHEDDQCLAVKAGSRMGWPEAVERTLLDLSQVRVPSAVELFTFSVATSGTSLIDVAPCCTYDGQTVKYRALGEYNWRNPERLRPMTATLPANGRLVDTALGVVAISH